MALKENKVPSEISSTSPDKYPYYYHLSIRVQHLVLFLSFEGSFSPCHSRLDVIEVPLDIIWTFPLLNIYFHSLVNYVQLKTISSNVLIKMFSKNKISVYFIGEWTVLVLSDYTVVYFYMFWNIMYDIRPVSHTPYFIIWYDSYHVHFLEKGAHKQIQICHFSFLVTTIHLSIQYQKVSIFKSKSMYSLFKSKLKRSTIPTMHNIFMSHLACFMRYKLDYMGLRSG